MAHADRLPALLADLVTAVCALHWWLCGRENISEQNSSTHIAAGAVMAAAPTV